MTKLTAFLIVIATCVGFNTTKAQSFDFTILTPFSGEVTDSTMNIKVLYRSSTYEIASVTAQSEGHSVLLAGGLYNGFYEYNGILNLSGPAQGQHHMLYVTFRDALGNEKRDSVNYIYANPPRASIVSPSYGSNISPTFRIKTSHTGMDTCTSIVQVTIGGQTIFRDTAVYDDIDTAITISPLLNGNGYVYLTIKDKWGQSYNTTTSIIADSYLNYLYMTPVYTGTGTVLDFNFNRILEAKSDAVYIIDSGFQTSSAIPGTYTIPTSGKLTQYGAYWNSKEWTNGVLYNINYSDVEEKYGVYAVPWNDFGTTGYDLYRKNLEDRSEVQVAHGYDNGASWGDVAYNGVVVYSLPQAEGLLKYKNGSTSYIAQANTPRGVMLSSLSGDSILFYDQNWENGYTNFYLHTATIGSLLSIGTSLPTWGSAIEGQYIAFPKEGTTNQWQIWVRDSTGNSTQRTFFSSSSTLAGLNNKGDLMFTNSNKLYYLKKDSIYAREIGAEAYPFYRGNGWYLIKRNTLYKMNIDAYRTAAAGNWSSASSWQYGTVPLPNADVIVDTNIVVDTDVICNTLKVIPPGSITVLPGVNLTVLH